LRDYAPRRKVENVPGHYTVGLVAKGKADRVAVDAEDALIAALRVKAERPDAPRGYSRPVHKKERIANGEQNEYIALSLS
jgi:hypothetical protein